MNGQKTTMQFSGLTVTNPNALTPIITQIRDLIESYNIEIMMTEPYGEEPLILGAEDELLLSGEAACRAHDLLEAIIPLDQLLVLIRSESAKLLKLSLSPAKYLNEPH